MKPDNDRPTMSIPEAAKVLGIGVNGAYEAAKRGNSNHPNREAHPGVERAAKADAGRLTIVDAFVKRCDHCNEAVPETNGRE